MTKCRFCRKEIIWVIPDKMWMHINNRKIFCRATRNKRAEPLEKK